MFTVIEQGASCGMEMVVSGCGDKVLIFNFEMKKMLLMDKVTPVMRYRTETELKGFSAPIHLSDVEAGDSIVFPHKKDVYILLEYMIITQFLYLIQRLIQQRISSMRSGVLSRK